MSDERGGGLPNLVIAGVTKAGTTSLHRYLGQHPEIGVADVKEVDHFVPLLAGESPPSAAEYAAHFRDCGAVSWRLDASPRYYIGGRPLAERLVADLDDPRVIISIREPVARLWSSFTYKHSKGRLPSGMGFDEFVTACERVADRDLLQEPETYRALATGVYADFLPAWFDVLGESLRIVFFDDLATRPKDETAELFAWLGLDPLDDIDVEARNATVQPRSQALRRAAYAANGRLGRVMGPDSAAGRAVRSAYQRLNAGEADLRLSDEQRARVEAFYAPTLPRLQQLLQSQGYQQLPPWLAGVQA